MRIQIVEKHEAIWKRYQELNKELIEKHGKEVANDLTKTFKYKILAEEFFLAPYSVRRIIYRFLNGQAKKDQLG